MRAAAPELPIFYITLSSNYIVSGVLAVAAAVVGFLLFHSFSLLSSVLPKGAIRADSDGVVESRRRDLAGFVVNVWVVAVDWTVWGFGGTGVLITDRGERYGLRWLLFVGIQGMCDRSDRLSIEHIWTVLLATKGTL